MLTRRIRGALALLAAVALGLLAARAVVRFMNQPRQAPPVMEKPSVPSPPPVPPHHGAAVPSGMRVVTLQVDAATGVSRDLKPGDRVDVVAVFPPDKEQSATTARLALENVQIFECRGQAETAGRRGGSTEREWSVGLLVNPAQGLRLAALDQTARLCLMLCNDREKEPAGVAAVLTDARGQELDPEAAARRLRESIPEGLRAVTVAVDDTDGLCGGLAPGDRVDVIVTCPYSRFASADPSTPGAEGKVTEYRLASRLMFQDVTVLATDPNVGPTRQVTLQVSPADAVRLAALADATPKSVIRLVQRHPGDRGRSAAHRQLLSDLLTESRYYHSVEIIRGTQRSAREFYH